MRGPPVRGVNIPTTAIVEPLPGQLSYPRNPSYIRPDMLRSASSTGLGFIKPELPRLVPDPPIGEGWIHEIKHDGYRTLVVIEGGQVRAFTLNGNDWTRVYKVLPGGCRRD